MASNFRMVGNTEAILLRRRDVASLPLPLRVTPSYFRNALDYLPSVANAGSSGVGEMWSRQLLMVFSAIPSKSSITCSFV